MFDRRQFLIEAAGSLLTTSFVRRGGARDPGRCRKLQLHPRRRRERNARSLKLGLHAGPFIAVTTGDALDYFGATVNIAARLERQCRGCEVIVSEAAAKDAETAATLADRTRLEETATLRGVSAPVRFLRVAVGDITDRVRPAPKGHKGRPTFDGP
jgi:class 3 adenylate cyclase